MLVHEIMSRHPVTVTPETPVKQALRLLAEHRVTSMPVCGPGGRVKGVVSEADLVRDLVSDDPRKHELPVGTVWLDRPQVVGDVMSAHAVTVRPDTDVAEAVELLTSTTVKSVPVLDRDNRVVGMLSRSDVVRALARADEDLAREVDANLASVGLGSWVAVVNDGIVTLSGPGDPRDRALARVVAGTVPGVVSVEDD